MAVRRIVVFGDPVLVGEAQKVDAIEPRLVKLVEDMNDTMYANRGVGLAAPQLGAPVQVIVFDTSGGKDAKKKIALLNPVLIERLDGEEEAEEGCLSIPEFVTNVTRASRVVVRGQALDGKTMEIEASGLAARVIQHEIDHLLGRLIIDALNPLQRDLFERKWNQEANQRRKLV